MCPDADLPLRTLASCDDLQIGDKGCDRARSRIAIKSAAVSAAAPQQLPAPGRTERSESADQNSLFRRTRTMLSDKSVLWGKVLPEGGAPAGVLTKPIAETPLNLV